MPQHSPVLQPWPQACSSPAIWLPQSPWQGYQGKWPKSYGGLMTWGQGNLTGSGWHPALFS